MKNMKKTILGVAVLIIALIVMMGSVNAADLTAASTVKKGETVGVNITSKAPFEGIELRLKYDQTKFKYKNANCEIGTEIINDKGGELVVSIASASSTNSITFNFEALEETAEPKDFTVSNFNINGEELTNNTVKVAVTGTENGGNQGGNQGNQGNAGNGNQGTTGNNGTTNNGKEDKGATKTEANGEAKVGTNGKVISKLPQTGAPVFVGAALLIVVAGTVLVVRKRIK